MKIHTAELLFRDSFLTLAKAKSLTEYPHFSICPTASNSIDTVAAWLAERKLSVSLIEPTFDNLALILKRRGVPLKSISEAKLFGPTLKDVLNEIKTDAIFLVNPNNPTGSVLSESQFQTIVEWCVENKKIILLDNTFRFFEEPAYDHYKILLDSEVTFISIEDTGKVWPTQDLKASLLFYSPDISSEVRVIYEEIYLCISNFALCLLSKFLMDAHSTGLKSSIWNVVQERRKLFRQTLENSCLQIAPSSVHSNISVEWVQVDQSFSSDLELMSHLQQKDITVLPGRNFFWASPSHAAPKHFVRFALLKPMNQFLGGLSALGSEDFHFRCIFPKVGQVLNHPRKRGV